ncbi:MAG: dual specificity protein phosphatase family protein [Methylococcales bacterium]|nr:dual specificity protein phosphatase family protein [Methylococcales bacterium]
MKVNHAVKCTVSLIVAMFVLNDCLAATPEPAHCANNLASPIANFCEVQPKVLWRGAKPDQNASAWLIQNGVKTIINLELLYDDIDTLHEANVNHAGLYQLDYFRVKTWEPLYAFAHDAADDDVIHFLAIAKQAKQPIYVHCRAGENRTGVMIAAYKIILQNQEVTAVVNEMQSYKGFWSEATTKYIKDLALRRTEILSKVNVYKVETPTHIICDNGNCESKRSILPTGNSNNNAQ